ncbi:hypothetical protein TanjilG_19529 [Lupinus angustifolius]|uniref:Transcriptional coactivator Hfi1/Transcriptional adapter 1 n=1 Tax=Lupinus angustifolius TaxID=3871 RepID=A0A1J7H1Y7_LUPAN|nr:PREDICTED: uncharacterized protein LOC109353318 [Lupinus angustifolius]OIW06880.1 hypothetical protein TanjilG_19529 [Lupinus angustifolius]
MRMSKRNYARIDLVELKALIARKVGNQRAEKYFDQLVKLFSSKISKSEFDKVCIMTIGKENIPLHNQLMKGILMNTCLAKTPPQRGSARTGSTISGKVSNGDALPPSPWRHGSLAVQSCKFSKGRQIATGALGKPHSLASEELISKTLKQQSATELNSLGSRPPVSVEDGEEVEQMAGSPTIQSRSPVTAPLGIPMNFGGSRKLLSNVSLCSKYYTETCHSRGDLPDSRSLRSRMEQNLEKEGLTVSVDCVNLLNNALDSYLKRLIESSLALARSRFGNEELRQPNGRLASGSNRLFPRRYMQTTTQSAVTSVLDFRVAMELNPQVLGPDWPIQLEKICMLASEE